MKKENTGSNAEIMRGRSVDLFLRWFEQRSLEHQLELAEFIGYFCYKPLYAACKSVAAKIFAFKEYLASNRGNPGNEVNILRFINDIIEFIIETNAAAANRYFDREELMNELPGISSLKSIARELPERNRKWLFTYQQWQTFKMNFPFLLDRSASN